MTITKDSCAYALTISPYEHGKRSVTRLMASVFVSEYIEAMYSHKCEYALA